MKERDFTLFINDILVSMEQIERFIEGMNFEAFDKDEKTFNAVIRSLEIIGEASKKVPDFIKQDYVNIPWKKMAGMRDKLIHEYCGVDANIVWLVCTEELPPLKPIIKNILVNLE
jgi:uncharacterized protein with HEPN domain